MCKIILKKSFIIWLILMINLRAYPVVIYVPSQYSTVVAAVGVATNGDIIDITGTFFEYQITVNKNITIQGHGPLFTTVLSISGTTPVFSINPGKIVTIKDMTISNGKSGIYIKQANVTIINCTVSFNLEHGINSQSGSNVTVTSSNIVNNKDTINSGGEGIGILNSGIMSVNDCNINNNYDIGIYTRGAGIFNSGDMAISNSVISHNKNGHSSNSSIGGGIFNGYNMTINNCTISNNYCSAGVSAGTGIYNEYNMAINNCTICHNYCDAGTYANGVGIYNEISLTITNSTVNSNTTTFPTVTEGGGIYNHGTAIIRNCCIDHNSITVFSSGGGGIYNNNILEISNSTVSNNSILGSGSGVNAGGIYNNDTAKIDNCTIARNSIPSGLGSGLYSNGPTKIKNTILALNTLNSSYRDYGGMAGKIISYGYNLVSSNAGGFTSPGDMTSINPYIDTLNYNGGPTRTNALQSLSPAINAGSNTDIDGNIVLKDQRGYFRNYPVDIGAYEFNARYVSVNQVTDNICSTTPDQPIIQVEFVMPDTQTVTSFTFNTAGTTLTSDIINAKLFYSDTSTTFSTLHQFGNTITSPNGNFNITGSQNLQKGENYFWLAYTISNSTLKGHIFDASCTTLTLNNVVQIPVITSPAGNRSIPIIHADFHINDSTQCFKGNNFLFTDSSTTTSGTISCLWNLGDNSSSALKNLTHHYTLADTFLVKLKVSAGIGCADSAYKKVYVFPTPAVGFSINNATQCLKGNLFVFTSTSVISSGSITNLKWNFGDNVKISNLPVVSHTYPADITYKPSLVTVSDLGCSDSVTRQVIVNQSPVASYSTNDYTQCLDGNRYLFINKSKISTGVALTYNWSFGNGSTSTLTNTGVSYSYSDTFTVRLIATSTLGCRDTFTRDMIVYPQSKPDFTINDSVQFLECNHFAFTNTTKYPSYGTCNFNWTFGDGGTDTSKNTSHSYNIINTLPVKLVTVTDNGCRDSIIKNVYILPVPVFRILVNDSIQCLNGNSFGFSIQSPGPFPLFKIQKYYWNFGDGLTDTNMVNIHHFTTADTYHVSLILTNQTGCTDTTFREIIVFPSLDAGFSINDSVQCLNGNSFLFSDNKQTAPGSWQWSLGDSTISTQRDSVNYSYKTTGSYLIRLIITDQQGCRDSSQKSVVVFPSPKAAFSINDTIQCAKNNLFRFTNLSDTNAVSFIWKFGDGDTASRFEPVHFYLLHGFYRVSLIVVNADNCFDSTDKFVIVKESPVAPVALSNSPVCESKILHLGAVSTPNSEYRWTADNGFTSDQESPVITNASLSDSGNYYVQTSLNGCKSDSSVIRVIIHPEPHISLGQDRTICEGDIGILDAGIFSYYLWQDSSHTRMFSVTMPGIYSVEVTNSYGCRNSDTIIFTEKCPPRIFIPDAFSPNGDGLNDQFVIVTDGLMHFEIRIFDRWGENVFHSTDPGISWNGTYKGSFCPIGTYTYMIYTTDNDAIIRNFHGIVTLVR